MKLLVGVLCCVFEFDIMWPTYEDYDDDDDDDSDDDDIL